MNTTLAHALHYGGSGLLLLLGGLSMLGIHLPGIDVNPAIAIPAGAAGFGIGIKMDFPAKAAMIPFALAIAIGANTALPSGAYAADLSMVKAPAIPAPNCTISYCAGTYGAFNFGNLGGNFDILGQGLSGLAQNGQMIGTEFGAEYWNGKLFAKARALIDYDVSQNTGASGITDRLSWGGIVSVGASLSNFFGAASQTSQLIPIPTGFANALMTPYLNLGFMRRHGQTGTVTGAGAEFLIANNWTTALDYYRVSYQSGSSGGLPTAQLSSDNIFMGTLAYHFGSGNFFGM